MKSFFFFLFIPQALLIVSFGSCDPSRKVYESERNSIDSIGKYDSTAESNTSESDLMNGLMHVAHPEDENYPWWDTPKVGVWIQRDFLEKLIAVHRGESKISLYNYIKGLNPCEGNLLNIEIEGCAKNEIFYLIHTDCGKKYIAKSTFSVFKKDVFQMKNVFTGDSYNFVFYDDDNLTINNLRYKRNGWQDINSGIEGHYLLFNNENSLLDTVRYNGSTISGSDSMVSMYLHLLTYVHNPERTIGPPTIQNADFVNVSLKTGKFDEEEKEPETQSFEFELLRTENGFELYNKKDHLTHIVKKGLFFRFVKLDL